MTHYVGLDVSKNKTSVCVIDRLGAIVEEGEVPTEPSAIIGFLRGKHRRYARIGLETVSLAAWLYEGLARAGLPAICIDAFHAHGVLRAKMNKTDRNDARGIAEIMRGGLYKAVHLKTIPSQRTRQLLTVRGFLHRKRRDAENLIRASLLQLGLKVEAGKSSTFARRVEAVTRPKNLGHNLIAPLLAVRAELCKQVLSLDRAIEELARNDPVCRKLTAVPGVAAMTALSFRAAVDVPERFARSRDVGVHFGLTPRTYQSGDTERRGRISKCGDRSVRSSLYMSAVSILRRATRSTFLQSWGEQIAARRGRRRALVAVARKLAVLLHRLWVTDYEFCPEGPAA